MSGKPADLPPRHRSWADLVMHLLGLKGVAATEAGGDVRAQLVAAGERWSLGCETSRKELAALEAALVGEKDPELDQIASRIARVRQSIPAAPAETARGLAAMLEEEDGTVDTAPALAAINGAASFLSRHKDAIRRCEDNPFDVPVRMMQPLGQALVALRRAVDAI